MSDKLAVGIGTPFWMQIGGSPEYVEMFEIVDPDEPEMNPGAIGYTYDESVGAEIVRRWNKHGALVDALLGAQALILEAQDNSHVLDWDGTDCALEMIEEVLRDESQAY